MTNQFLHFVLFFFKDPQNSGHREQFEASLIRFMNNSQYAGSWHVGTPAGTERIVVDSSYTYSLLVTFPSKEIHDLYQAEPAHLKFISECSQFWDRVQVCDSLSLTTRQSTD